VNKIWLKNESCSCDSQMVLSNAGDVSGSVSSGSLLLSCKMLLPS